MKNLQITSTKMKLQSPPKTRKLYLFGPNPKKKAITLSKDSKEF